MRSPHFKTLKMWKIVSIFGLFFKLFYSIVKNETLSSFNVSFFVVLMYPFALNLRLCLIIFLNFPSMQADCIIFPVPIRLFSYKNL